MLLTMVQDLYLLEVFILAHGRPSTETPTTETTIVQCHKNSWLYLTRTCHWWLLRPTITIRFDSKFQTIAQLFNSIGFELKKHYSHSTILQVQYSVQIPHHLLTFFSYIYWMSVLMCLMCNFMALSYFVSFLVVNFVALSVLYLFVPKLQYW